MFHNGSTYDYHFVIKELAKNLKDNLNAQEKVQKNVLRFQYPLKKILIMAKQLYTKQSLLIALDLSQAHYQALLIIY